jgi:anti-sigma B factor antagonist
MAGRDVAGAVGRPSARAGDGGAPPPGPQLGDTHEPAARGVGVRARRTPPVQRDAGGDVALDVEECVLVQHGTTFAGAAGRAHRGYHWSCRQKHRILVARTCNPDRALDGGGRKGYGHHDGPRFSRSESNGSDLQPARASDLMPARFEVKDEALDPHRHIVAVSGEVDLYTAADLKAALSHAVEEGCTSMVIDLTKTHFMDSTGLSTLVSAQKRMRSRGGKLVIVNVDPSLAYTFQITGLDLVFKVVNDRGSALRELEVV